MIKNWKRIEVIKDYRFYIVCANMLAMPWIATGIFVYQSFILSSKNWGPYVIAQSFMAYSVLSVITLFIAGFLIDKAGLKGKRIGDAEISTHHANFFINHGNASASDITELIRLAKSAVLEEFNIELELEIKTIGFEKNKVE